MTTRSAYVGVAAVLEEVVVIAAPAGRSVEESSGLVEWVKSDCFDIATLILKWGDFQRPTLAQSFVQKGGLG